MDRKASTEALWCAPMPLVLASRSEARQALLRNAGIPFDPVPVELDERLLEAQLLAAGVGPGERAVALARSKGEAASLRHPGRMVVGADQILVVGNEGLHKPVDRAAAARQLRLLSGKSHVLHAGVAVVVNGETTFVASQSARMTMRELSASFIERYLDCLGAAASASVGAYAVEELGIQLFCAIDGDHSTILGLPMLPLLAYLREQGSLLA